MKFLLVVFAALLAFAAMTNADNVEVDNYIAKLEDFFDCANNTAAGSNSSHLEAAFKVLQASIENLITSQIPSDQLDATYNETLRNAKIYFGEFTKTTNISESEISFLCQFPGFPADLLKTNRTENDQNGVANENNKTDANPEDKSNSSDDSDDKDGKETTRNDEIDTSDDSDDEDGKATSLNDGPDTSDGDEYIEGMEENQSETAANNNGTEATNLQSNS